MPKAKNIPTKEDSVPITTDAYQASGVDSKVIKISKRILNTFENDSASPETDYASIYIYKDGDNRRRQITLARGFTQDGGNLWKVLEKYIQKKGSRADFFSKYKNKMNDGNLYKDKEFLTSLIKASKEDQLMRDAQDEIFDGIYLTQALDYFESKDFTLPLSFMVIFDSTLQSGGILSWLTKRFPEKLPSSGGNEKTWISQYIQARHDWLSNSSSQALRNSSYRTRFFLGEIKKKNWSLSCPIVSNGSKAC